MLEITCKYFDDLTVHELYEIMALRLEVFCVEQNCPYQDADGRDSKGWHLMLRETSNPLASGNSQLVAYARLLPKGVSYDAYASIGRVVNSPSVRGTGVGKILLEKSIEEVKKLFPSEAIKIGAQSYLLRFYESFGFESTGEEYLEDDIPHTAMILKYP